MKALVLFTILLSLSLSAKVSIPKSELTLGTQKITFTAEIIDNKMPSTNGGNKKYIIIMLKSADGKKIKEKYTITHFSLPSCKNNFRCAVTELRDGGCIVRNIPDWATRNTDIVITIKDSHGVEHHFSAKASLMVVH